MAERTYPVALDRDIRGGSLARARLDGIGLVLWRADDDVVRVWRDRCPHRSIRLSAGRNLGAYVEGAYHGWRFGKDGTVTGIPAEGHAPRPEIKVEAFASTVCAGLVWAAASGTARVPADYSPARSDILLRPLPFAASAADVREALVHIKDMSLIVTPTSQTSCLVFGHAAPARGEAPLDTLRRCNDRLTRLRRGLEARAAA